MKYFLLAGEASGDLHGSNLVRELKKADPDSSFLGCGGDLMQGEGVRLVHHYRSMAFMGFIEVLSNLLTIRKLFQSVKKALLTFRPDTLILIDYPGFNLRMAEFASRHGIRVIYYISPKVWAWKSSRVKKIKRFVNRMYVILPFEQEFYRKFDYPVSYEGNPLIDSIDDYLKSSTDLQTFLQKNNLDQRPLVGLIPGSRVQELHHMLPVMIEMAGKFPAYQFVVAGFEGVDRRLYDSLMATSDLPLLFGQTRDIMKHARAALVTSGTATLEAALLDTPQVVCYRGNPLSFFIARLLVKIRHISLVNLIAGKTVVTELIQREMNPDRMYRELKKLIEDEEFVKGIREEYSALKKALGSPGVVQRLAKSIVHYLDEETKAK